VLAYVAVLRDWMRDDEHLAWHRRPRSKAILRLVLHDPALAAAYRQIMADAQDGTARVAAARLGVDPALDLRPATLAGAATSGLTTAGRAWLAADDLDLPEVVEQVFSILHAAVAGIGSPATPRPV